MSENFPKKTSVVEKRGGSSPEEPPLSGHIKKFIDSVPQLSIEELMSRLTKIQLKVEQLEKESRTDDLTGLLNRRGFREEWDKYAAILRRERSEGSLISSAFLAIDLDGFKSINDTIGHDGGDRFLQLVAERVQLNFRKEDVFARTGGDEFSVFLFGSTADGAKKTAVHIRMIIEDINGTMREEYPTYHVNASASIGVVTIDGEGHIGDDKYTTLEQHPTMAEIRNYADYALYVAKEKGKRGEFSLKEAWEADPDREIEKAFRNL